ncbi:MAG: UDP-N-acetylmuramoyl-L-alanyl-D-glutamate--2,6-diaminopimelate ligase, partial [Marivivens sp.]|nr:UDP-N-acetylmuramoyl-L-alanyl-D-glutamate--2,6-diaminopimelate ligase [Marivivens sp.]
SEDPALIRAAVIEGAHRVRTKDVYEVGDRAEAILRAADMLQPGDALLVAGKGHETGQIVGTDVLHFDDVEVASQAVLALDGKI